MSALENAAVRRVQAALESLGLGHEVVALERSCRTAADAARAVGCEVGQIAKSLVFKLERSNQALLVITSGTHRVDEPRLGALVGEPVGKADADFVREQTGFPIGGVAPVGHARPLTTLIDQDLLAWPEIWAAAGHPHTVFRLDPNDLPVMTGGRVVTVA